MENAVIVCPNCGREIAEAGLRFCPNCGAWLGTARPAHAEEAEEPPSPALQPTTPSEFPASPSSSDTGHNPWEAAPPPALGETTPPPSSEPERTITRSPGGDVALGFFAVLLLNLALPSGLRQLIADVSPALGSGVLLYIASICLYLFLFRERYPAFARGWRGGLLALLILIAVGILLMILVVLGLFALCVGAAGRTH